MKNITIFTILCTITFSCSNVQCESYSKDVINSLELIGEGDYKAYRKFMDKYEDPDSLKNKHEICVVDWFDVGTRKKGKVQIILSG